MKIFDINIITSYSQLEFQRKLQGEIDKAQRNGFEVEIKYSTAINLDFETEYSALVLTKCNWFTIS